MQDEILDFVDEKDTILGSIEKNEARKKKLILRIVHILIFDKQGRMALQLRGKDCAFCPHHWSTSVGGHVMSKEAPEDAAMREFKEELGTSVPITFFKKDFYKPVENTGTEFLYTYKAVLSEGFHVHCVVVFSCIT